MKSKVLLVMLAITLVFASCSNGSTGGGAFAPAPDNSGGGTGGGGIGGGGGTGGGGTDGGIVDGNDSGSDGSDEVVIIGTVGLKYTLINSNTAYSVSLGTATDSVIGIPAEYQGKPVIQIDTDGFAGYTNMTEIVISNSVTSIGSGALKGCDNLTSITVPFVGASPTGYLNTHFGYIFGAPTYGDQNSYIPSTLKKVVVAGISKIASGAFQGCTNLTNVIVSKNVTDIGYGAFQSCSGLTSITIPFVGQSLIGGGFFSSIFGGDSSYVPVSLKTVIVTGGGYTLPNNAFLGCVYLTSITIPESVTSIGQQAFSGCSSLTNVIIPNSVNSIGSYAFYNCTSLASLNIPNGVTSIGQQAFYNSSLTSVTIPSSITSIGNQAFSGCSRLTSVTIPSSVTSIGQQAFSGCSSLTNVTIPSSVTSIGQQAFSGCSGLTSVTIPDSVTSIGVCAFNGCTALTSITVPFVGTTLNGANTTDDVLFYGIFGFNQIPSSLKTVVITGGNIGQRAFAYCCSGLTSVTIGNSVTGIGDSAFLYCSSLTNVIFQGMIPSSSFNVNAFNDSIFNFPNMNIGDLRTKFYASNPTNGTPGTYTRPNTSSLVWTKQ